MKLRNKITGEIVEAHEIDLIDNYVYLRIFRAGDYDTKQYNSLAELNEEWEDYEEPKEYWCIDWTGGVNHIIPLDESTDEYTKNKKEIGNYFETREEAEKALEKLKAWKRLKDKGFRFNGLGIDSWDRDDIKYEIELPGIGELSPEELNNCQELKDLNLLFSGEDD